MKQLHYITFQAMGCQVHMQLETEADGASLLQRIPEQVEAIEARLSRFRPASELMRLNDQSGRWVTVSDMLFENVHAAKHAARLTEGLYNPLVLPALLASGYDRSFERITQPETAAPSSVGDWHAIDLRPNTSQVRLPEGSAIDLGGIAKGWTAAKIADELAVYGPCMVDMGGDIAVRGTPMGQSGWLVEVEEPGRDAVLESLWLSDTTITTSGIDYRRWTAQDGSTRHHIIDPRTGLPSDTDLVSVTIVHPHAPTAEAYAKAVLLMGSQNGLTWLNQQWYAGGLIVRTDGAVLINTQFTSFISERIES
jgi:thiamine biosynthesis lipoprotein